MYHIRKVEQLMASRVVSVFGAPLQNYLENEFLALCEHLGDGETLDTFDLTTHGEMSVLTENYKSYSLDKLLPLLPSPWPEFVKSIKLSDGTIILRAGFLVDNDYCPLVYFPMSNVSDSVLSWLEEQSYRADYEGDDDSGYNKSTNRPPF